MSEEQTFRREDNTFLPLRRRQLSVPCVTRRANRGGEPSVKKDFETEHSGVFASPGLPLAQFLTAESGLNHELCPDNRENAVRLPRKSFAIARLPLTPGLALDLPDSATKFRLPNR